MTRPDARRRNAVALAISTVLHVLFFAFVVAYVPKPPPEPELIDEPLNVTIMPMPDIPPPPPEVIIPPKMTPRKIEVAPETPPVPVPAPPQPPKPEPPKPQPQKPEPPTPSPTPPKPTPPKPAPIVANATLAPVKSANVAKPIAPKLAPLKAPSLSAATPTLAPTDSPKPPAPVPSPQASASPSPAVTLDKLNLHKPKKETPANVPTLPVAGGQPAGGSPAAAAAAAALNGAPFEQPGSRLSGLNPYPYGMMPSGGSGLRGSLVGCANAQAVGLSSVERAHCAERFGTQIHHAPVIDGISPAKRAGFDAALERQQREQSPRGIDPMEAMHSRAEKPCPSEPDIRNSPASFQGCSH